MGSYASIGHKLVIIVGIMFFPLLVTNAQKMDYALCDVNTARPFHDGLAVFYKDGYDGVINTSGKVVIEPKFKSISDFYNGTAIVTTETGDGIINRSGTFILEPVYSIMRTEEEHPDVYTVTNKETQQHGLFYNGRFVLPIAYTQYPNAYDFPFISYDLPNGQSESMNTLTGETFENHVKKGTIVYCIKDETRYYYNLKGEPIDKDLHKRSSKGVLLFQDETTKDYGLKSPDGSILLEAKYAVYDDIWIHDRMQMFDSKKTIVANNQGKIILSSNILSYYDSGEEYIWEKDSHHSTLTLYDATGKKLTKLRGKGVVNVGHKEWFNIDFGNDKEGVYDVKHMKLYKDVDNAYCEDGIIIIRKTNDMRYCYNAETGLEIAGPLEYFWGFHEGLAVIQRKGQEDKEIIDKNGKVILKENEKTKFGNEFSEGVISVTEEYHYNYMYNPLGHGEYVYTQNDKTDRIIAMWNQLGHKAFEKKQYATAKDYYYRVMMNDPTDVDAVINYGAALGNLGYYDEAIESCRIALDIDPDNQLAKDNLRINLENKQIEEERLQAEEEAKEERRAARTRKSSTFWDALGNFANILSSVAGGVSAYQPYSSFSMDMDYSSSSSMNSHDYQSEYNRWARLAERHYNSLTNLGYRSKHKDGSRSGGTLSSMSGGNYVQMKKSLRDAQHEMQRIRRKAAQNGVTITPSTWETATVGY